MAQTLDEAKRQACAVFEGVVTAVEPIVDEAQGDIAGPGRVRVQLRVVQTWTPGLPEAVSITTADNSAACGVRFEVGRGYLVFADGGVAEAPTVSLCGGTKAREDADKDIAALGMGVVPVSPSQRTATSSATARRGGCAGCHVGAASRTHTSSAVTVLITTLALWCGRRALRR